jgi:hypothetical protein
MVDRTQSELIIAAGRTEKHDWRQALWRYCEVYCPRLIIPEPWRDGFRWAILGGKFQLSWPEFILSVGFLALPLVSSVWGFRWVERRFADAL